MSNRPSQIDVPTGPSAFLSHARTDQGVALEFHHLLTLDGFKPWVDGIDLVAGQRWESEIERAVRDSDCVVVLLSKNSVDHRGYVQKEISLALEAASREPEQAISVLPVCLDDSPVPDRLAHLHWVRLSERMPLIGAKYSAIQRALLARADQLKERYDVRAIAEHREFGMGKSLPTSFVTYKTVRWMDSSLTHRKARGLFRVIWEGGNYLVRGQNPTGDTYAGVARLQVHDGAAELNVVIGVHLLSYRGTFDGETLALTGSHDVTYVLQGGDRIFRGTWGKTGYEELIPSSPFARRVEATRRGSH